MSLDRRRFLSAAGGAAAAFTALSYSRVYGANERVGVAVIGVNGRGKNHITAYAKNSEADIRAVVDIDQSVNERASAMVAKEQGGARPKEYADMRKMFESKEIDAVSIATPNYWHALATIWACQAGKDVYVEKPASHNIFEGRKMVEAARKYERMVQVGQQSRSTEHVIEAIGKLREGAIGELYMAKGLCYKRRKTIGEAAEAPVPPGVDYDMWLGPAWPRAWKQNRFHYNWHWYWDFGNGDIGNQGVHEMDVARWGLGLDNLPDNAVSEGGKFVYDDDQETPNTQIALFRYPDKQLQFEVRGLITGGDNGLLEDSGDGTAAHVANFLSAVKSRHYKDLNCDIEIGHRSAALCHMANISYRTGDKLRFDPTTERFLGHADANRMLTRDYRAPYVVPEKV